MKGPFTVSIDVAVHSSGSGEKPAAEYKHTYRNLDQAQMERIQFHLAVARDAIESNKPAGA